MTTTSSPSTGGGNASGPAGTIQLGRDHWPRAYSNIWFGGGIQTGRVIGATDKRGEDVAERMCNYYHLNDQESQRQMAKVSVNWWPDSKGTEVANPAGDSSG